MTNPLVVHCKRENFDVYIGRPANATPHHYGNPFSNRAGTKAAVVVNDPVAAFDSWLAGTYRWDIEPARRGWILSQLPNLSGKVLGCWCVTPEQPDAPCHGWVLARRAMQTSQVVTYYEDAPACATEHTDIPKPASWVMRDGQRVPMICILGVDMDEAHEAQRRLAELRKNREGV